MRLVAGIFLVCCYFALMACVLVFQIWLWGSLITSGIKRTAKDCDQTYKIEQIKVIHGDWFCPNKVVNENIK